jgi:hypothetical protein
LPTIARFDLEQTNMTHLSTQDPTRPHRVTLAVALWVFAISTTVLLIGIWGRSVTGDEATLQASAEAVLETEVVTDRVGDWLAEGLDAVDGGDAAGVAAAVDAVDELPAAQDAIDTIVSQVVTAALAPPGSSPSIDVAAALGPVIPELMRELEANGVAASTTEVEEALEVVDTITLPVEPTRTSGGVAREARAALTKVIALAALGMFLGGGVAIAVSDDRWGRMRSLASRVAVSSFTFAILLQIGRWATDPEGGRSPLAAGSGVVLGSNWQVLVVVAAVGMALAGAAAAVVRRSRQATG